MEEQRQIEAMARLDGWSNVDITHVVDKRTVKYGYPKTHKAGDWEKPLPAYLTSHDAVQRVIDGLSDDEQNESSFDYNFPCELAEIVKCGEGMWATDDIMLMSKANPAQKAEAILKATGKWEK